MAPFTGAEGVTRTQMLIRHTAKQNAVFTQRSVIQLLKRNEVLKCVTLWVSPKILHEVKKPDTYQSHKVHNYTSIHVNYPER